MRRFAERALVWGALLVMGYLSYPLIRGAMEAAGAREGGPGGEILLIPLFLSSVWLGWMMGRESAREGREKP